MPLLNSRNLAGNYVSEFSAPCADVNMRIHNMITGIQHSFIFLWYVVVKHGLLPYGRMLEDKLLRIIFDHI